MIITVLSLLIGMLTAAALITIVTALRRPQPALQSALDNLSGVNAPTPIMLPGETGLVPRAGLRLARTFNLAASPQIRASLRLRGVSEAYFFGERLFAALLCGLIPTMIVAIGAMAGATITPAIPAATTFLGAVFGWYLPVIQTRRATAQVRDDSSEALLTYIDLVVLERLSNAAAVDALSRASLMSDAPLFQQIRQVLNRAALENVPPWAGLRGLATEINLPQLTQLVAIAQLQSEGASLSEALRARVAELRGAHLLRTQEEAHRVSQRMIPFTVLPALAVIVILIAAPMLGLLYGT